MFNKSRVTGKWELDVFENFRVDRSLPKHCVPRQSTRDGHVLPPQVELEDSDNSAWAIRTTGGRLLYAPSLWVRFLDLLTGRRPNRKEEIPSGKVDPIEIFGLLRDGVDKITMYLERNDRLTKAIAIAKQAGQVARVEALTKAEKLTKYESVLFAAGLATYLTEAAVIEFASKCKKGLALTFINNYSNQIPVEIVEKKVAADKLKVFDNYAILHWDPKKEAFALTEREIAAKRDPILFGLIENSRKLYFVADWKDTTDDLDMAEVNRVLGRRKSDALTEDPEQAYVDG